MTTKDYLRRGKDGYDVFPEAVCLADGEMAGIIPSVVKNYFEQLNSIVGIDRSDVGQMLVGENSNPNR